MQAAYRSYSIPHNSHSVRFRAETSNEAQKACPNSSSLVKYVWNLED